jgi:hypothetical protein
MKAAAATAAKPVSAVIEPLANILLQLIYFLLSDFGWPIQTTHQRMVPNLQDLSVSVRRKHHKGQQ